MAVMLHATQRLLSGIAFGFLVANAALAQEGTGYLPEEGTWEEQSKDYWKELHDDKSKCSGNQQSPINVAGWKSAAFPSIVIQYVDGTTVTARGFDAGHTFRYDLPAPKNRSITVRGKEYKLAQFHFHHPSEHLVQGKRYPMEMHLVHEAVEAGGGLAVVAVFLEVDQTGTINQKFSGLAGTWQSLANAKRRGQNFAAQDYSYPIKLIDLLPSNRDQVVYQGSLTTPKCDQTVTWIVMTTPVKVAQSQINDFKTVYPMIARMPQPLNRRFLLKPGLQ